MHRTRTRMAADRAAEAVELGQRERTALAFQNAPDRRQRLVEHRPHVIAATDAYARQRAARKEVA